jgi:predicted transcriptional regulator
VLHLWYTHVVRSTTSSFRISNELRTRLERAARRLNQGKNAIITLALEEYLDKFNRQWFLEEARRQSILASAALNEDEIQWAKHADTSGWK